MRRGFCVPMMALLLLLAACAGGGAGESKTVDLRQRYHDMTGCTMEASVLCGQEGLEWEALLRCEYVPDGESTVEVLEPEELIRIYAASGKVFAVTGKGEYTLRLQLYELEERLSPHQFVRISNSEIIHLKKVVNFDLSFAGTIYVKLSNGTVTYVSRRYVSKIKKILGI